MHIFNVVRVHVLYMYITLTPVYMYASTPGYVNQCDRRYIICLHCYRILHDQTLFFVRFLVNVAFVCLFF